jgi:hypothetical protein
MGSVQMLALIYDLAFLKASNYFMSRTHETNDDLPNRQSLAIPVQLVRDGCCGNRMNEINAGAGVPKAIYIGISTREVTPNILSTGAGCPGCLGIRR